MRIEIEADDDATVIIVTGGKARVVEDPQALTTRPAIARPKEGWFQRQERNPRAAEPMPAPKPPEQPKCE